MSPTVSTKAATTQPGTENGPNSRSAAVIAIPTRTIRPTIRPSDRRCPRVQLTPSHPLRFAAQTYVIVLGLEAVLAVSFGALLFAEPLTTSKVTAVLLIVGGIAMLRLS